MEIIKTNIEEICERQFNNMREHGFVQTPETGTSLMLIVSELAEALEADRKLHRLFTTEAMEKEPFTEMSYAAIARDEERKVVWKLWFEENIKDTFEDEIADTFLRLFDFVGRNAISIDTFIEKKSFYNSLREQKNGKQY